MREKIWSKDRSGSCILIVRLQSLVHEQFTTDPGRNRHVGCGKESHRRRKQEFGELMTKEEMDRGRDILKEAIDETRAGC